MAITVVISGKQIKCPLLFIETGSMHVEGSTSEPTEIRGYSCPFKAAEIIPNQAITTGSRCDIDIESIDMGIFRPAPTSAVPHFDYNNAVPTAIGTVWHLKQGQTWQGTILKDGAKTKIRFTVTRDGATISFTKDGAKLDGVDTK